MIIACEQCETRFQLDEARIPARGARVRCSRCKHAFFVAHPEASAEQATHDVVREALADGASAAPAPAGDGAAFETEDADAPSGPGADADAAGEPGADARAGASADAVGDAASDADGAWEFDDGAPPPAGESSDPPRDDMALQPGRAPDAARQDLETSQVPSPEAEAPAQDASAAPAADEDLEALGDPEEWNLLEDAPRPPDPAAEEAFSAAGASDLGDAAETAAEAAETAAGGEPSARRSGLRPLLAAAAAACGWGAILVLTALPLSALLARALEPAAPRAATHGLIELPAGSAHHVRGGFLENALGGRIFVVSGRFEPRPGRWPAAPRPSVGAGEAERPAGEGAPHPEAGPEPLRAGAAALPAAPVDEVLTVALVSRAGRPLAEARVAGPALGERALREAAPEHLQARLAEGGPRLVARGGRFQAVFAEVPPEAVDFSLDVRRLPRASRPPEPGPSPE